MMGSGVRIPLAAPALSGNSEGPKSRWGVTGVSIPISVHHQPYESPLKALRQPGKHADHVRRIGIAMELRKLVFGLPGGRARRAYELMALAGPDGRASPEQAQVTLQKTRQKDAAKKQKRRTENRPGHFECPGRSEAPAPGKNGRNLFAHERMVPFVCKLMTEADQFRVFIIGPEGSRCSWLGPPLCGPSF
jgi:hypothetical protein